MKTALEEAQKREDQYKQQVQEMEQTLRQAIQQHQEEMRVRDEELRIIKAQNDQLIRDKELITQQHIQEAYETNMSLHRRNAELQKALHEAEALSRERAQQVREMEEVPKIPISPDDQLETEHRLVMEASSEIVSLALESRSVDQTLTMYYNALTASAVQYSVNLTQPLSPNQLTLLLHKYSYYTHPILAMTFFRGDLCLEDQTEIYQLPIHPVVLNFRSWCRCIQETTNFAPSEPIMEVSKPFDLPDYPYPQDQIFESQFWMQTQGWIEARSTYQFLVDRHVVSYNPMGIIVLYNRVYECLSTMYTTYSNHFDTSHVAYPEQLTTEDQTVAWAIFTSHQPPLPDPSDTTKSRQPSSTTALHTYPVMNIPPYILPTSTSLHSSAPTMPSPPILPTPPASHNVQEDAATTHNLVKQMLDPLVKNSEAVLAPVESIPDLPADLPQEEEDEEAKPSKAPEPPKEWTEHVYTF